MLLHFVNAFCVTLIVPKKHLDHRLSYKDGLKIIRSSTHESTRIDDYFTFADQFTYLTNADRSLCKKSEHSVDVCPKSVDSLAFKIEDVRREARFRIATGKCLTVGKHHIADDSYDINLMDCSDYNDDQVFVMYQDHGDGLFPEIDRKNVMSASDSEKDDFRTRNFRYK